MYKITLTYSLHDYSKKVVMDLPNFDAEIFKE